MPPRSLRPGAFALILAVWAGVSACETPRSPREAAEGSVTGEWTAHSAAVGAPHDTGQLVWRVSLEERQAGRISGRGEMGGPAGVAGFDLTGIRGESAINFEFGLPDGPARFVGSILEPRTLVGRILLPADTFPITFTRR